MEVQSVNMKPSTTISISCLEEKVLFYKNQCSKLLSIILNELKELSNGSDESTKNHHFETLTKTIKEHLTSKYEIEFAYLRERDEAAMIAMEHKINDLEAELKKTREASKISEDGVNLLIRIRKEDAQTQAPEPSEGVKPNMRDNSTFTEFDSNQNILIHAGKSSKSALARYATEDTIRLEDELRKEKETKHKMQSSLSKRIHTLTKQLEAARSKIPKAVIKDLRSREDTPPRAVSLNAYKMIENSRRQISEQNHRNSTPVGKNENERFSVYRKRRRTSIDIDGECNTPSRKNWKCGHPQNSRRSLNSKRNGYDFCNNCKTVVKNTARVKN